ncbi:MAG: hypothetical protein ACKOC5_15510 [Chloroflexota bacterium]
MPRRVQVISLLVLLIVTLPYLLAALSGGQAAVFGGFLMNPQDGYSYLAKMRQGWQGSWTFRLPFSAEPGEGAYLFLFYLLLGHIARWLGLPPALIFHAARLLGAAALLVSLWNFIARTLPGELRREWAFTLACLGLGLGWLAFPAGLVLSDFWVAEAYPFLSMYATPHFALGLALMLWLLLPPPPETPVKLLREAAVLAAALILAVLSPFGVVVCGVALGGWLAWEALDLLRLAPAGRRLAALGGLLPGRTGWAAALTRRGLLLGLGSAVPLLYAQWAAAVHPALAVWNAQNLTLTPAAWDVLAAMSPAALLALPGAGAALQRGPRPARLLLIWAALGLLFIYLPLNLQRRFMMGLYVPLAALAAYGLAWVERRAPACGRRLPALALGLALPTTLLIVLVGLFGALSHDPQIYLQRDEWQALHWLEANTPAGALVLGAPESGLLVPAFSGRRVIYGHPYETVNAAAEQQAVEQFFRQGRVGDEPAARFLERRGVAYLLYGPRERRLGPLPDGLPLQAVFTAGEVRVYQVVR